MMRWEQRGLARPAAARRWTRRALLAAVAAGVALISWPSETVTAQAGKGTTRVAGMVCGNGFCTYPNHAHRPKLPRFEPRLEQDTLAEVEPNNNAGVAQVLPLAGGDHDITVTASLTAGDTDWFRVSLFKGDVLGAATRSNNLDTVMTLFDGNATPPGLLQNDDHGFLADIYPVNSPLPGGNNRFDSALSYVMPADGELLIQIRGFDASEQGAYTLEIRNRRPGIESQGPPAVQTIFCDFDGATINAINLFGQGNANAVLSPLATFLDDWGLTPADESAVIDSILATVRQKFDNLRTSGINGDRQTDGRDGSFDYVLQNSRDHADPFGQPNVSRLIFGGTIDELGIATIGIASAIDPGNFGTTDTAVILLDMLSAASNNPNSINQYQLAPGFTMIDAVGRVVGTVGVHEAGHYLGLWHTDQFNSVAEIIDQGGNLDNTAGVGPDRVLGSSDDVDVRFIGDTYVNGEGIGRPTDFENTDVRVAFALSTGGQAPSQGTAVTLQVTTLNSAAGGRAITDASPIEVSYTLRGNPRTATVTEGTDTTIFVDPGSTVQFPTFDRVATAASGNAAQRWYSPAPQGVAVGAAPLTITQGYYHQLRKPYRIEVQSGATPLSNGTDTTTNVLAVAVIQAGQTVNRLLGSTAQLIFADTGSISTFDSLSSGSGSDQRWVTDDADGDGVADPATLTVTTSVPEMVVTLFHQVRIRVQLSGTNSSSVVSTTKRRLFGDPVLMTGLFGTFREFCDNRSQVAFSAESTGTPILAAEGVREFTVVPGLDETVTYTIQPRTDTSVLNASSAIAPANGRTVLEVVVTIRDSSGSPVAGIAPDRVVLFPDRTNGLRVSEPRLPTDSTGRLTFSVTSSQPYEDDPTTAEFEGVTFTASLDGISLTTSGITAAVRVQFQQVLTVPLTIPGLYLISFPVTPADSHSLIRQFNVAPQPTQMARLVSGTSNYAFFRPDTPNPEFLIIPGKGFWLRTNTAGTAELTGSPNYATNHDFRLDQAGFHQLGNPFAASQLIWRLNDVEVFVNGEPRGLLSDPANWGLVDPVGWSYNGTSYEIVVDPAMPGSEILRTQVRVFEGFLWRTQVGQVLLRWTPNSGRAAAPAQVSPANFAFGLTATQNDVSSQVMLGASQAAHRAVRPPADPAGEGSGPVLSVLGADGSRAALDWVGGGIVTSQTWEIEVASRAAGEVVLNWPSLVRLLPAGYRVRLTDPTNGRSILLNTSGAYRWIAEAGTARRFQVTCQPRSSAPLQVVTFQPAASRSRQVSFDLQLTGEAELFVEISSLSGRLVARTTPVTADGAARLVWDGLDNSGRRVPAGTYRITLIAHSADGETVRAVRVVTVR